MLEILGILLGLIQGLFEWLPVSSEGQIVLILTLFFNDIDLQSAVVLALFAHIGTAFVVLLYYRKDYAFMLKNLFDYKRNNEVEDNKESNLLEIIIISTLATIPTALISLLFFEELFIQIHESTQIEPGIIITILIGIFLIFTGFILRSRTNITNSNVLVQSKFEQISRRQAVLLGLLQGFAAIPGISRSGITVTYLLLGTKLDQNQSLRGSFLISVPATMGAGFLDLLRGKIFFQTGGISVSSTGLVVLSYLDVVIMTIIAFIIGGITLKSFLEIAKTIPFDKFMILFGLIAVLLASITIII